MQLVIAEKPSVARDLARALGVPARGAQAFEGERWVITWCVGHLVELEEPAAYDSRWKAWRLDTLPILPGELRLRAAEHARGQLQAVTRLLRDRRFTGVVNACDAGREGELIFRYLLRYAKVSPPVRRLWISALTEEAIRQGLAALRPGAAFDALGDAARCRSEADWLVGMNATRAVTARARDAGGSTLFSIGRVQTPTLAMLVARERELEAFVATPYWEVRAELAAASGPPFTATWRHRAGTRLASAELAQQAVTRAGAHGAASAAHGPRVEQLASRTVKEPPPLLFDLTSLQRTANRRFGFSAAHTLEVAQTLYERAKLLTYPRTDSRHLSSELVRELPGLFSALAEVSDYQRFAEELVTRPPRPSRRVVDDSKVRDHHAIIPTAKVSAAAVAALGRDERRLFDLVARRFLGAFFPDAELAVTEVWIAVGPGTESERQAQLAAVSAARGREDRPPLAELPPPPDVFFARGRVRTVAGWQEVAGISDGGDARRDEREDEPSTPLPVLVRGQKLDGSFSALAKQTTPPPRYTEATLLGAMEAAGKSIDGEALREAMKERGLGTPATRASIIETLLRREYLVRSGKHLVPTATGRALIAALAVPSLCSPELTGEWEARLARIARGQDSRSAFMADIERYVTELVAAVRTAPPPAAAPGQGQALGARATAKGRGARARGRSSKRGTSSARPRSVGAGAGAKTATRRSGATEPAARATTKRPRKAGAKSRSTGRTTRARGAAATSTTRNGAPPAARPATRPPSRGTAAPLDATASSRSASTSPATGRATRVRSAAAPRAAPPVTRPPSRNATTPAPEAAALVPVPLALAEAAQAAQAAVARAVASAQVPRPAPPPAPPALPRRGPPPPTASSNPATASSNPATPATASAQPPATPAASELACPRCGQGHLVTGQRGWGCSRWREGCRFVIWFQTAGRHLSPAQLRDLVRNGKTRKATFQNPDGASIPGRLVLDPSADGGAARLEPA